ncbi:low temperature requirement protein A [Micromonospora sp. ALFpr18c]|uniref:low temperature requirement protein A n=1 Tax=unclassified Micromonospora TaxID=2617518 RepID=UPI001788D091|nr:low temperature requirement protein A [Micromonospora sp. ALFpr18c]
MSVPGRSTRIAPYTHLVLLVGVAVTATSFDLVVDRPTGPTPARWLMLIIGGPLVFVLGRALFTYLLSARLPYQRIAWQLLPLLMLPWAGGWPPVLVTAIMVLALAGHVLVPVADGRETTRGLGPRRPAG